MVFAQIKNGNVVNIIALNDESLIPRFSEGFDAFIRVDGMLPYPSPNAGWTYDGVNLIPPPPKSPSQLDMLNKKIADYEELGPKLIRQIKINNTLAGITVEQSAQIIRDYGDILQMVNEGMFPTALYALQNAQPSGFATQDVLNSWIQLLQSSM